MKGGMVGEEGGVEVEGGVEGGVFKCPANLEEYKGNGVDGDNVQITRNMLRTKVTVSLLPDRLSVDYTIGGQENSSNIIIKYDQIRNVRPPKRASGSNWFSQKAQAAQGLFSQKAPGRNEEFEDADLIRIDGGDGGKKLTLSFPRGVSRVKSGPLDVYLTREMNSASESIKSGSLIKLHEDGLGSTPIQTSNPYAPDRKGGTGWVRRQSTYRLEKTDFYREFCTHLRPKLDQSVVWNLESDTE